MPGKKEEKEEVKLEVKLEENLEEKPVIRPSKADYYEKLFRGGK